jgi:hypothetical protein
MSPCSVVTRNEAVSKNPEVAKNCHPSRNTLLQHLADYVDRVSSLRLAAKEGVATIQLRAVQ